MKNIFLFAFLFLTFLSRAEAGCTGGLKSDDRYFGAGFQWYNSIHYQWLCDTIEEASAACHAFEASLGVSNTCISSTEVPIVSGGWTWATPTKSYLYGWYYGPKGAELYKNAGRPKCDKTCAGDPVNISTGNKYEIKSEYRGSGVFPIDFTWTYNSQGVAQEVPSRPGTEIGRNRSHTYSRKVVYSSLTNYVMAYVTRPNGGAVKFDWNPSQSVWVATNDHKGMLVSSTSGSTITGWEYVSESGGKEVFDGEGKLLEIYNESGFKQVIGYDTNGRLSTVTDPNGRSMVFQYASINDKKFSAVNLPDGTSIGFVYENGFDLNRVNYPDGKYIQYLYNESGYVANGARQGSLTGVVDENLNRYSSTTYDSLTRATSTYLAGGVDRFSMTYQTASVGIGIYSSQTSAVMPGGATRQLNSQVRNGQVLPSNLTEGCTNCSTMAESYTFDNNGNLDVYSKNGVTTDYDFDSYGLLTQVTEAANDTTGNKRTTQATWDTAKRKVLEERVYDAAGVLKYKQNFAYNSRNQILTESRTDVTSGSVRATTYIYCESTDVANGTCPYVGLLKSVNRERTDVSDLTTYTYRMSDEATCTASPTTCPYRKGDLWKETNALGQTFEILKYDGSGRVLSEKDINGVVSDYEYDSRGRVTAVKVRGANNSSESDDRITRTEYWPNGLVRKITAPNGSFTSYTYDAAQRLTMIQDNEGNRQEYTLNNLGATLTNETKTLSGTLKKKTSFAYDALGRMLSVTDAYNQQTAFSYDSDDRVDIVTDAFGRKRDNDYDVLGRLRKILKDKDGIAAETKFGVSALDQTIKVTDPKKLDTNYTSNGFGERLVLQSPDTGITSYTYDGAGNVASETNANGKVTSYTYDALNRLTFIDYEEASSGPSLDVTYLYDVPQSGCVTGETFVKGRISKRTDGSGNTVYCYNRFGDLVRLVQTINGKVFTLTWVYSASGQMNQMIYPDGLAINYGYDSSGRMLSVGYDTGSGVQSILSGVSYHPFGPASGWTFGNGRTLTFGLDLNYNPISVVDSTTGGIGYKYSFDALGNMTELRDENDQLLRSYEYDRLNRLEKVKNPVGVPFWSFSYDKTGNRSSIVTAVAPIDENPGGPDWNFVTNNYVYPSSNHKLSSNGVEPRQYDAAGNTTQIGSSSQPGGVRLTFAYDNSNRLSTVDTVVGSVAYTYNGAGQRVRRLLNGINEYHVYLGSQLIGVFDNSGSSVQRVIWMGDTPVGLVIGNGLSAKMYYVEADILDTPRVVIDPVRNVAVWKWDLEAEPFGNSHPNTDPDMDGTQFSLDMRFPGQMFDSFSGHISNYYRDFDPSTGRYLQSDPIGLAGGMSTYAYAESDPMQFIDPFGLAKGGGARRGHGGTPQYVDAIATLEAMALIRQIRQNYDPNFTFVTVGRGGGYRRTDVQTLKQIIRAWREYRCPTRDGSDRQALMELLRSETRQGNGVPKDGPTLNNRQADTFLNWARELGVRASDHRGPAEAAHWGGRPHIHINDGTHYWVSP
jgi:RHS repeat-associated protein